MSIEIILITCFLTIAIRLVTVSVRKQQKKPKSTLYASLQLQINGKHRFADLQTLPPHETSVQLQDAAKGQHPFVVVMHARA